MSLRSFSSSHRSRPFGDIGFGRDCFRVPEEEAFEEEPCQKNSPPPPVFLFGTDLVQGQGPTEKIVLRNSWGQYEQSLKTRRTLTQQHRNDPNSDRTLQKAGARARFDSVDAVEDEVFDHHLHHNNMNRNNLRDGGEQGLSLSPEALRSSSLAKGHGKHNEMRVGGGSVAVPHIHIGCSLSPSPSSPHGANHHTCSHNEDEAGDARGRGVSSNTLLVSGGGPKSTTTSCSPTPTCGGRVVTQSLSSTAGLSISNSSSDDANSVEGQQKSAQRGREILLGQPLRFGDDLLRFHDDPPRQTRGSSVMSEDGGVGTAEGMRAKEMNSPPFPSFWKETTKEGMGTSQVDALERPKSQRCQGQHEMNERIVAANPSLVRQEVKEEEDEDEPRSLGSPLSAFWERRRRAVLPPSAGGLENVASCMPMKSSSDISNVGDTGVDANAIETTTADLGMGPIEEVNGEGTRGQSGEARAPSSSPSSTTTCRVDSDRPASEKDHQPQLFTSLVTQLGAEDDWLVLEMPLPIVLQHYTILAHERDRILERLNLLKERAAEVGAGLGVPYEAPGDETNPPRLAFAPSSAPKDEESAKDHYSKKVFKGNSYSSKTSASEEILPSTSLSKAPQDCPDHIELLPVEDLDESIFLVPPTPLPSRKQRWAESQPRQDQQQQQQHKPSSVLEEYKSAPVLDDCSPPSNILAADSFGNAFKDGKDGCVVSANSDMSTNGKSVSEVSKAMRYKKARSRHSEDDGTYSLAFRAPSSSIFSVHGGYEEEKREEEEEEEQSSRVSGSDLRGEVRQREHNRTVTDHPPQKTIGRWLPQSEKEKRSEATSASSSIGVLAASVQFAPYRSSSEPIAYATATVTKATPCKAMTTTSTSTSTANTFQRLTNDATCTISNRGKERLPFLTSSSASSSQKASSTAAASTYGSTSASASCSHALQNNRGGSSSQSLVFTPFGGRGRDQNSDEGALPHNEEGKDTLVGSRLDSRQRLAFAKHADPHPTYEHAKASSSVPLQGSQSQRSMPCIPLSEFLLKRQSSTNATTPTSTVTATPFTGGGGGRPTAILQHTRHDQSPSSSLSSSLCRAQGSTSQERLSTLKQNEGDAASLTYGHRHAKNSTSRNKTNRSVTSVDGGWQRAGDREIPPHSGGGDDAFSKPIARVTHDSGNRGPNVRFGDLPIDLPVEEVLSRHYRGWEQHDY